MITMLPLLLLVICLYAILMDAHHFSPFERQSNMNAVIHGARAPLRYWAVLLLDLGTQLLMVVLLLGMLPAQPLADPVVRFWRTLAPLAAAFLLAAGWNHVLNNGLVQLPRPRSLPQRSLALLLLGVLITALLLFAAASAATPDYGTALMYWLAGLPNTLLLACLMVLGFYLLRLLSFFLRAVPVGGTLLHAAAHTILLAVMMQRFGRMLMGADLPAGANVGMQGVLLTVGIACMAALLLSSYLPGARKKDDPVEAPELVTREPVQPPVEITLEDTGGQISCGKVRVEVAYDPFGICVYGEKDAILWKLAEGGLRRERILYSFFSFPVLFNGNLVRSVWHLGGKSFQRPIDMRVEGNSLWINLWDAQVWISFHSEDILHLKVQLRQPSPNFLPEYRALSLACEAPTDAHYLGFGQRFNRIDQRGRVLTFLLEGAGRGYGRFSGLLEPFFGRRGSFPAGEQGTHFPIPFFLTSRDEGAVTGTFWDSYQPAWVEAGCRGRTRLTVLDEKLDLYLYAGPNALDVIRQHTHLTGSSTLPPAWAFLPWKTGNAGATQENVSEDIVQFRKRAIPLAHLGIDHWQEVTGSYEFSERNYPQPQELVKEAHDKGYRITARHFPYMNAGSGAWREGLQKGYFVQNRMGLPYQQRMLGGAACMLDYTHPAASAWHEEKIRIALLEEGFQGVMNDGGEALPPDAVLANGRSGLEMRNAYPVLYARAMQRAVCKTLGEDHLTYPRLGYAGSQRFINAQWPGDQENGWEEGSGLPAVVRAMLNLSMGGLSVQGSNINGAMGAFNAHTSKELFLRRAEVGAYSPLMRAHGGTQESCAPWNFDQETVSIYQALSDDHVRLFPYLYSLAHQYTLNGAPIMRHPALIWHSMRELYEVEDAWMLGDALYVAPVLKPGLTQRRVLLPPGLWWSLVDGKMVKGEQEVTVAAVPGCVPLFLRQGFPLPRFAETFDSFDASDFARPGRLDSDLEVWLYPAEQPAEFSLFDGGILSYHKGKGSLKGGAKRNVEWKVFEG